MNKSTKMIAVTVVFLGFLWGGGFALNGLFKEWMFFPAIVTFVIAFLSYIVYMVLLAIGEIK